MKSLTSLTALQLQYCFPNEESKAAVPDAPVGIAASIIGMPYLRKLHVEQLCEVGIEVSNVLTDVVAHCFGPNWET